MGLVRTLSIVILLCGFLEAYYDKSPTMAKRRPLGDFEKRLLQRRAHERMLNKKALDPMRELERRLFERKSHEKMLHKKASDPECGSRPVDFVFVLDESGSIWGPDFHLQLTFVNELIDSFKIGVLNTHIGVLTFANDTKIHMNLGEYLNDPDVMKNVVSNIVQRRGNTRTDLALSDLRTKMLNNNYARDGVPHITIVITDGESQYVNETAKEARLVKEQGTTVFAIGVGRNVIDAELHTIATDAGHVYKVDHYKDLLENLKDIIPKKACEVTLPPTTTTALPPPQMIGGCYGQDPLDIIFGVPDEAGIRDTGVALEFISDVVSGFKIGRNQVQVGLTPKLCVDQASIAIGENDDLDVLLEKIAERRLTSTLLSQQLEYIIQKGLTYEDGARDSAKDVAILLVDNEAEDAEQVALLAQNAKSEGITLIFIGVGDYVKMDPLEDVASSSRHTFFVPSYDDLMNPNINLTQLIYDLLCSEPAVPIPPQSLFGCNGSSAADIIFSAADEAGIIDTEYTLDFFQSLIDNFTISATQVQVGMTPRLCGDLDEISLQETDDKESLKSAIGERILGSTLLSLQLEYLLAKGFSPSDGARDNARKISIMVVDNRSEDPDLVQQLADEAKDAGILLITIGVGDYVDMEELAKVSSSDKHLFHVDMFEELMDLKKAVLHAQCTGVSK